MTMFRLRMPVNAESDHPCSAWYYRAITGIPSANIVKKEQITAVYVVFNYWRENIGGTDDYKSRVRVGYRTARAP